MLLTIALVFAGLFLAVSVVKILQEFFCEEGP